MNGYMKGLVPTITRIFRRSIEAQTLMRYYWEYYRAMCAAGQYFGSSRRCGF